MMLKISVADPGFLSLFMNPNYFHPGSRIQILTITDPGSISKKVAYHKYPGSRIHIKKGCLAQISRIPDPVVKKAQDPGSTVRIHNIL
jgi:hypothetical protein